MFRITYVLIVLFSVPTWLALIVPISIVVQKSAASELSVELRVLANNQVLKKGQSISLKLGQSVQLKVELMRRDGRMTDVTTHPKTRYFSTTPWIVSVTKKGLVTATSSPAQKYQVKITQQNIGAVLVSYGNTGDREIGAASIVIDVRAESGALKEGVLSVAAPQATLRVGETVQLTVLQKLPDGTTRDLTDPSTGTIYITTNEFVLIPEPDGRVTCVGILGRRQESASIVVKSGELRSSIRFKLLPGGPGPTLEVVADKTVLHEGEGTQVHIYKILPSGKKRGVTTTSTGTRYLTFTGYGRVDPGVISITKTGVVSAPESIGRYNRRSVIIFVRNEKAVGWVELKVVRAKAK